jgi:hypothetical protein
MELKGIYGRAFATPSASATRPRLAVFKLQKGGAAGPLDSAMRDWKTTVHNGKSLTACPKTSATLAPHPRRRRSRTESVWAIGIAGNGCRGRIGEQQNEASAAF